MEYIITFLEGIISFISPCLLPMLPIYLSYFSGETLQENKIQKGKTLSNALGFVLGFTIVFLLLGIFAGTFGRFIHQYQSVFNIIFGIIMILFGLNFMQVLNIPFLNQTKRLNIKMKNFSFFTSLVFGIIFSVSWTPCIGAFLGSALMLVASQGEMIKGMFMLLLFSLGLGIPFILSALLIDRLKKTFAFIKKHYKVINAICGSFLILIGFLMMTGMFSRFLALFS